MFSTEHLACSKDAGTYLFGKRNRRVKIINNAVNSSVFKFDSKLRIDIRNKLGLDKSLAICHIGRFTDQKNHKFLMEVFKELHNKCPESVLILVGEGNLKPKIEEQVIKHDLSSNVKFLGERKDIPQIMQAMDLFILPSLYEGFPIVLVEAQAAGLRCLVSDTVAKDCDVTGNIEFLSIEDTKMWVERILTPPYSHIDTSEIIKENGFDIVTNARKLCGIYSGL